MTSLNVAVLVVMCVAVVCASDVPEGYEAAFDATPSTVRLSARALLDRQARSEDCGIGRKCEGRSTCCGWAHGKCCKIGTKCEYVQGIFGGAGTFLCKKREYNFGK